MKYSNFTIILLITLCIGCSSNSGSKSESETDSITTQIDTLSNDSSMDDYDWTPDEFKTEHPDEWAVVKPDRKSVV